jgi:hypothetical protein
MPIQIANLLTRRSLVRHNNRGIGQNMVSQVPQSIHFLITFIIFPWVPETLSVSGIVVEFLFIFSFFLF